MNKIFNFEAIPSGDYESFCFDVSKETFISFIKAKYSEEYLNDFGGIEAELKNCKSVSNDGMYRLYPDDFFKGVGKLKIRIETEDIK